MTNGIVRQGVYRHYKGPRYIVLFVGQDSNNDRNREPTVVYMSLTEPHTGSIRTRRVSEFLESVLIGGKPYPRFELETDVCE
jgi:hypothetical protein